MTKESSIVAASNAVRRMWEKHGVQQPLRFFGYCLSLLPVPVVQQVGSAMDRHYGDRAYNAELTKIWNAIEAANPLVGQVETVEEAIQEIAKAVEANSDLEQKTRDFALSIPEVRSEFQVLTENKSYQELRNTIISADISAFIATGGSTNILKNTEVVSDKTHLHASDGSKNLVDGTKFTGRDGGVSMQGITAEGLVSVEGSGIGLGRGGSLTFGGNPNRVSGNCPFCSELLSVDKQDLVGMTHVKCHKCSNVFQFNLP